MKKSTLSIIALGIAVPHAVMGTHCLGTCGSTTIRTDFCSDEALWCSSSGGITGQIGNTNSSYQYCMPLQGDITTPTSATYIVCFSDIQTCKNRNWTASTTGKEYSAGMKCSNANSAATVYGMSNRWRCATGYYSASGRTNIAGSSESAITCNQCPPSGGVYGTTSGAGAVSITECYLPSGTTFSFSDSIGSGTATYTSNCYYSN